MCQWNLMDAFAVFWMQWFTICYVRQGPFVESGLFNFFYSYISNINNASFHILLFIYYREAYISVTLVSLIVCFSSLWFSQCLAKKKEKIHRSLAFTSSLLVMDSFSDSCSVHYLQRQNYVLMHSEVIDCLDLLFEIKSFLLQCENENLFFLKYNSEMNKTFLQDLH